MALFTRFSTPCTLLIRQLMDIRAGVDILVFRYRQNHLQLQHHPVFSVVTFLMLKRKQPLLFSISLPCSWMLPSVLFQYQWQSPLFKRHFSGSFVPFNVPSVIQSYTFYAVLYAWLPINLCFPILDSATVQHECSFVLLIQSATSNTGLRSLWRIVTNQPNTPLVPRADESKWINCNQFCAHCHKIAFRL